MAHLHLVAHDMFGAMHPEALCKVIAALETGDAGVRGVNIDLLARMLARADRRDIAQHDVISLLAALFDDEHSTDDIPVAAFSYLADTGQPPAGYCLRADPVSLKADRDRVVLYRARDLLVSKNEALEFVKEITTTLGEPEWRLEVVDGARWYLHLEDAAELSTVAPGQVLADDVFHHLPSGKDGSSWRRRMNEIQMLLHNSPLNQLRSKGGLDLLNSIWLWGGGTLQPLSCERWTKVMTRDPFVKGLALASQRPVADLPATADQLESILAMDSEGDYLMVMEPCPEAVFFGDLGDWFEYILIIIDQWLEPLMTMLDERKLDSLTLYPGTGVSYTLNRKMLRKWWHREKKLSVSLNCTIL